jgi:hypothetical protein
MRSTAVLLLLAACAPRVERSLQVLDGAPSSSEDTAGDTGLLPPSVLACGDDGSDPGGDGSAIPVEWCARVTPEGPWEDEVDGDTGPPPEVDTDSLAVPPPCGFANLVGSLALAGTPSAPAVLYCDSDLDGGTRFVQFDASTGRARSSILSAMDCQAEPATGTLVDTPTGYLAVWAGVISGEGGANPGVMTARLDAQGALVSGPDYAAAGRGAWKIALAPGDTPLILVNDTDMDLWAIPVGTDEITGGAVAVTTDVHAFAATSFGGTPIVAACLEDQSLHLDTLDAAGGLAGDVLLASDACGWSTQPSFAVGEGVLALGWDDGSQATVAFFDPSLAEIARVDLGEETNSPQVVWTGDAFFVLTSNGALTSFSPDGDEDRTWWHHGITHADGSAQTDRLLYGEGRLVYGFLGMDSYPIGGGHVNTFNYFEISGSALP